MTENKVYYGGEGDFIDDMEGGTISLSRGHGDPNEIYSQMKNEEHLNNRTTVKLEGNLQQPDGKPFKDTINKLASLDNSIGLYGSEVDDKSVCLLYLIQDACIKGKKILISETMESFSNIVTPAYMMIDANNPSQWMAPTERYLGRRDLTFARQEGNDLYDMIEPKKEFFGYEKRNREKSDEENKEKSIPFLLREAQLKARIIEYIIKDFDDNMFNPDNMLTYYNYYLEKKRAVERGDKSAEGGEPSDGLSRDEIDKMKQYLDKGFMGETYTGLSLTYTKNDLKRSSGIGYFSKTVDSLKLLSKIKKNSKDNGEKLCDIILFIYGIILKKYVTIIAKQKNIEKEARARGEQLNINQYALDTLLTSLADLDGILKIIDHTFNDLLKPAFAKKKTNIRLSYLLMKKSQNGKGKSIIDLLFQLLFDANHKGSMLQKYYNEIKAIQKEIAKDATSKVVEKKVKVDDKSVVEKIIENNPRNRNAEFTQVEGEFPMEKVFKFPRRPMMSAAVDGPAGRAGDNRATPQTFFDAWTLTLKKYSKIAGEERNKDISSLADGYLITKEIFKKQPIDDVVALKKTPTVGGPEGTPPPPLPGGGPDGAPSGGGGKKSIKKRAKKRNKTKQVKKSKRYAKKKVDKEK